MPTRRTFIQQASGAGAGVLLAGPLQSFSQINTAAMNNIKSKGYAAKDASGKLSYWEFKRRPVGGDDILIDIKFASICHSDIHLEPAEIQKVLTTPMVAFRLGNNDIDVDYPVKYMLYMKLLTTRL